MNKIAVNPNRNISDTTSSLVEDSSGSIDGIESKSEDQASSESDTSHRTTSTVNSFALRNLMVKDKIFNQEKVMTLEGGHQFGLLAFDEKLIERPANVYTMKYTRLLVISRESYFDMIAQKRK